MVLSKLYLQKRKKQTPETNNRELIALLSKLEKIDFTYTDCFGRCPTKEINDRQNSDIDPFEEVSEPNARLWLLRRPSNASLGVLLIFCWMLLNYLYHLRSSRRPLATCGTRWSTMTSKRLAD